MAYWHGKRAIVTGASAGLGRVLAATLVRSGARVALTARGGERLEAVAESLRASGGNVLAVTADVTQAADVSRLSSVVHSAWGGIDLVCHCAGRSMRGTALATSSAAFEDLWRTNFLSAVLCAQQFAQPLTASRGHLVLVGSLASKVASGYLGAYPASKFPLAALAQQLRIEVDEAFHVLLLCPGPIAREEEDAGGRYAKQAAEVPAAAHQPGGGARVKAIDPQWLSSRILHACERRKAELIVPSRARLLFALAQLSPRLGDWLLRKMTV